MKLALISGASSGLGRECAQTLADAGYDVIIHFGKNKNGAEETKTLVEQREQKAYLFQYDLTKPENLESELTKFFEDQKLPHPSVLINNAGIHIDMPTPLMSYEDFDQVMKVNTYAPFVFSKWFCRHFRRGNKGQIVNISSVSAKLGNIGQTNYAASKAALLGMTKSMALENAKRGIRVNALCVGVVQTKMIDGNDHLEMVKSLIPLQRFGQSSEVASVVNFLCSEESSYMTGQVLNVDGGLVRD
jgi:3-oxoacyl-[acyl-carrier protein] reductase